MEPNGIRWERATFVFRYITESECSEITLRVFPAALLVALNQARRGAGGSRISATISACEKFTQVTIADSANAQDLNPTNFVTVHIQIQYRPSSALNLLHAPLLKNLAEKDWNVYPELDAFVADATLRRGGFKVYTDIRGSAVSADLLQTALTNLLLEDAFLADKGNSVKSPDERRPGYYELMFHPGPYTLQYFRSFLQTNIQSAVQERLGQLHPQPSSVHVVAQSMPLPGVFMYLRATITSMPPPK